MFWALKGSEKFYNIACENTKKRFYIQLLGYLFVMSNKPTGKIY